MVRKETGLGWAGHYYIVCTGTVRLVMKIVRIVHHHDGWEGSYKFGHLERV